MNAICEWSIIYSHDTNQQLVNSRCHAGNSIVQANWNYFVHCLVPKEYMFGNSGVMAASRILVPGEGLGG